MFDFQSSFAFKLYYFIFCTCVFNLGTWHRFYLPWCP